MADHLRFSVAYWHTFRNPLSDPFGIGTALRPWDDGSNSVENACNRAHAAFEFIGKLGAPFYAFPIGTWHQKAPAWQNPTVISMRSPKCSKRNSNARELNYSGPLPAYLSIINPRFAHGAATSPNADVFVYAAAQVKKAIDVAHELGAEGYVFWGGREGYSSLWNTDMKREVERSNTLRNSCTWP